MHELIQKRMQTMNSENLWPINCMYGRESNSPEELERLPSIEWTQCPQNDKLDCLALDS